MVCEPTADIIAASGDPEVASRFYLGLNNWEYAGLQNLEIMVRLHTGMPFKERS